MAEAEAQAAVEPKHIGNRLTITGRTLRSFSHSYWTDSAPQEKVCTTLANTLQCRCGLFTLVWARG